MGTSQPPKRKFRLSKISEWLGKGKETAEIAKVFTPDPIDKLIDQGVGAAEVADEGVSVFKKLKDLFRKEKR